MAEFSVTAQALGTINPAAELRLCEFSGRYRGSQLVGQSDESLPPERRIAFYRGMAAEALRLAQAASDEALKASYVDIAARWNLLAAETERWLTREGKSDGRENKSESQAR